MLPDDTTAQARPRKPFVTVVTVVFNGARDIASTIESVLAQDCDDKEYVIVDGGSVDGTLDIVAQYDNGIDLVVSEPDAGIYDAMNKAVARASGEFILFMNCGDTFASVDALSAAARAARRGSEQVIFGSWLRRDGGGHHVRCLPSLDKGLFNHQAILYSRSIHDWHGDYVDVRGLSTADYLFFATLLASGSVECKTVDVPIATIDVSGVSAGLQTFSQKHAVDYLCGRTSRLRLILVLAIHPLYSRVKQLVRRRWS
jgi:glycosyltransferase involved in cell wall biosynthesis